MSGIVFPELSSKRAWTTGGERRRPFAPPMQVCPRIENGRASVKDRSARVGNVPARVGNVPAGVGNVPAGVENTPPKEDVAPSRREAGRSMGKVAAATAVWSLAHSALASRALKQAVQTIAGRRRYNTWYRPFYVAQSVASLAGLGWYARGLPDRTLYRARGKTATAFHVGQGATALYFLWTLYHVGIGRASGISNLVAGWDGRALLPDAEGQGPSPDGRGGLRITGPFRRTRHPLNVVAVPLLWLFPRMTAKLAAFNLVATLYFYIGSFHEETRLRAEYGRAYADYQAGDTPFYLPRLGAGRADFR